MTMNGKKKAEVVCMGQVVLDCIVKGLTAAPREGVVTMADSVTVFPGGDAFNESVILSRLGIPTRVHGGLGRDLAGNILTAELEKNGVDTGAILRDGEAPSPVACLFVGEDGKRKSVNTPAHGLAFFRPDTACFQGARVVSLASLFRAPLADPAVILQVCRDAKAAGAVICADMKIGNLSPLRLADIREALPTIDYLFPNETEGAFYTGQTDFEAMARTFLDAGVKNVILKTGEKGCLFKNREVCWHIPAHPVPVRDTTGAGDNFAAGFIASLIWGRDLREALVFATACAAICVGSIGATAGVRDREQVMDFIKDHPLAIG